MSRLQDICTLGTYSKLLCNRNAIGASGWMMMLHVFGTSTSKIAFRLIFLEFDRDPSVATSLSMSAQCWDWGFIGIVSPYHTVATPPSRDVRTFKRRIVSSQTLERAVAFETYFRGCRTWRGDKKRFARQRFLKERIERPGYPGRRQSEEDTETGKIWKLNLRWDGEEDLNRHDAPYSDT